MDELFATLPKYLGGHLVLSLTALAAAVAIGVPLGIYASRRPRVNEVLLAGAGTIQTVPSLALLGLLVVVLGGTIGFWPAFVALVLYAILPVLANTVVGIRGVDVAHLEAARGVGMTPWQILRQVELPLAAPVLLGGIRTATVLVVGTATLATPVGGVSLGNYIFAGLGTLNHTATVFGCVAVALLALVLDQLLLLLQVGIDWRLRGWWSRPMVVAAFAGLLGIAAWGLREPVAELFPARSRAVFGELFAQLPAYLGGHLVLSVGAVAVAVFIGVPLGIVGYWWPALGQVFRAGAGVVQTLPSLALLGLLVVVLGGMIGFWPAFIALVLYAILPILANTLDGLRGVDPALTEAARGIGMTPWQTLRQVELPLAAPVLLGGVRTATVLTVGTATLATAVGGVGLGNYIFAGLATLNHTATVFGCVVAAVLAVGLDRLIRRFEVAARERDWAPARWAFVGLALLLVGGLFDPVARWWTGKERVVIASLEFTEQYILSRVIAGEVDDAGFDADRREGMPYGLALEGLRTGSVDCMVAYTGDIVAMLLPTKSATTEEVMDHLDKEYGVPCLGRLGFENNYCVVINPRASGMDQVRTIDDLVKTKRDQGKKLRLGADMVFFQRDEWPRFQALHGLTNDVVEKAEMAPTLLYQPLVEGTLDAIVAYSSDGRIPAFGLFELADTKQVFRKYEAILLVSRAAANRPGFLAAVRPLLGKIEQATMREANRLVDVDQKSPAEAASSLRDEVRKLRLLDRPQDGDERDRPDDGDDQLADQSDGRQAEQAEQPAAEDRADDADDEVGHQVRAAALHDLVGDPAGAQADQQEVEELHDGTPTVRCDSPRVSVAGRGRLPSSIRWRGADPGVATPGLEGWL